MKKLLSILTLMVLVAGIAVAQKSVKKAAKKGADMSFNQTTVDYGTIKQHADPLRKFAFVNNGTEPLIITGARGSCGCTVPSYPKKPILPGEEGVIEVRYDTKRLGKFRKTVRVTTNEKVMKKTKDKSGNIVEKASNRTHILYIKGEVKQGAKKPAGTPTKKKSILEG